MTYNDLVGSYIRRHGGSPDLIASVIDYLDHADAHDDSAWDIEHDDLIEVAVSYANRKHWRKWRWHRNRSGALQSRALALNLRHLLCFEQEVWAIRRGLRRTGCSNRQAQLTRLAELEQLIRNSKTQGVPGHKP